MPLIPAHITFRGLGHSRVLEGEVHDRIAWLERYVPLVGCRVVVEVRHHHQREGRAFHLRLDLTVAGLEPVVIDHEASLHGGLMDADAAVHHKRDEALSTQRHAVVAIHEAFAVARRRLQSTTHARREAGRTSMAAF